MLTIAFPREANSTSENVKEEKKERFQLTFWGKKSTVCFNLGVTAKIQVKNHAKQRQK
jgi:hypothetical protein